MPFGSAPRRRLGCYVYPGGSGSPDYPQCPPHPSPRPTSYEIRIAVVNFSREFARLYQGPPRPEQNKVNKTKQYIYIHREIRRPSAVLLARRHGATVLGHVVDLSARQVDMLDMLWAPSMLCLEPRVAIARPTRNSNSPIFSQRVF